MNRRNFLKAGTGALIGSAASSIAIPTFAQSSGKTVIVIFQRGGADGLSMLVPWGDDLYYNLRPGIGIGQPGSSNGAIRIDDYFGLHPSMQSLQPLLAEGHLAYMPSVHYPDGNQSHFESMQYIEQAIPHQTVSTGWLNRYIQGNPGSGFRASTFDWELDKSLRGVADVVTINDLEDFNLGIGGEREVDVIGQLESVYGTSPRIDSGMRRLTHRSGTTAMHYLGLVQGVSNSGPANGAVYPDGRYGKRLAQIAQLIKANVGLEIATTNIGGWDTHDDQGAGESDGDLSQTLREFSDGIAALYQDLGPAAMRDVVILTMTEFGRTAEENASRGTDHGAAACWMVVSGADNLVAGQHGQWPGLAEDQLYEGRYLDWSIDYRDIMGDILSRQLGVSDPGSVIPDHTFTPTGLFG